MSNESYMLFFRKHWLCLLPTILIFGFIGAIAIVFVIIMTFTNLRSLNAPFYYFIMTLSLAGFSAYTHWFFLRIFEYFFTICILSDHRLLALSKTVYTHDLKETADLKMIQDVKKEQNGIVRNFLRYGDLIITLSSSSAIMILRHVPNVEFHFRSLMRTKNALSEYREHQPIAQATVSAPTPTISELTPAIPQSSTTNLPLPPHSADDLSYGASPHNLDEYSNDMK